jgi:hypothetical protein
MIAASAQQSRVKIPEIVVDVDVEDQGFAVVMCLNHLQTISTAMFQENAPLFAGPAAVDDDQVNVAKKSEQMVRDARQPMAVRRRLRKSLTRKWTITGEMPILELPKRILLLPVNLPLRLHRVQPPHLQTMTLR